MYNSNKNKYLIYIMAKSGIDKFKTAISNAYKHLKKTEIEFTATEPLKESDIIKQLIDKLNEKSPPVPDGGADSIKKIYNELNKNFDDNIKNIFNTLNTQYINLSTTNNKAISITKYNYGYYLNTIEDKEYLLFIKLFINYLMYLPPNINLDIIKDIYNKIKLIYKIYKKNIIYINDILFYIIYYLYKICKREPSESYNYITIDDILTLITTFHNNINIQDGDTPNYYNISCKILITFSEFITIDNTDNKFLISNNNYLIYLSYIFAKNLYLIFDNLKTNLKVIISSDDDIDINKEFITQNINKIIESLYDDPYKDTNYLIINKDKDIIDIFKENPKIEDNYNIDNNSLELVEISKNKINFNNNTYKLIGYIDENDEYKKIGGGGSGSGDGGGAGDGGKYGGEGEGGEAGVGAAGKGDEGGEGVLKYKLLIYIKTETETEKEQEKNTIIGNLKALYENPECKDININNSLNSCYLDSLFVALFSAKHKFMDDMLYNLKINSNFENRYSNTFTKDIYQFKYNIIYDDNDKKQLYYYASLIKKELIESYNNISMKKHKAICVYTNIRSYMKEYFNIYYKYDKIKITDIKVNNTSILTDTDKFNNIIADLKDTWSNKQKDISGYINHMQIIFNDTFFNLPIKLHKNDTKVYKDDCNIEDTDTIDEQTQKIYNFSTKNYDYSTIIENIIIHISDYTKDYNMIDDGYKLYNYDKIHLTVKDKDNISWSDDGYVIIGTENIYTKNLPKARYLQFNNIKNIKINPSEKLFLNDKTYNENSENSENTPFLSLQSIIIIEKGATTDFSIVSGHYTCIFKCIDKWYLYNDTYTPKVSMITPYGDFNNITEEQKTKIVGLYYI